MMQQNQRADPFKELKTSQYSTQKLPALQQTINIPSLAFKVTGSSFTINSPDVRFDTYSFTLTPIHVTPTKYVDNDVFRSLTQKYSSAKQSTYGYLTLAPNNKQQMRFQLLDRKDPKIGRLWLIGIWIGGDIADKEKKTKLWACMAEFMRNSALQKISINQKGKAILFHFESQKRTAYLFEPHQSVQSHWSANTQTSIPTTFTSPQSETIYEQDKEESDVESLHSTKINQLMKGSSVSRASDQKQWQSRLKKKDQEIEMLKEQLKSYKDLCQKLQNALNVMGNGVQSQNPIPPPVYYPPSMYQPPYNQPPMYWPNHPNHYYPLQEAASFNKKISYEQIPLQTNKSNAFPPRQFFNNEKNISFANQDEFQCDNEFVHSFGNGSGSIKQIVEKKISSPQFKKIPDGQPILKQQQSDIPVRKFDFRKIANSDDQEEEPIRVSPTAKSMNSPRQKQTKMNKVKSNKIQSPKKKIQTFENRTLSNNTLSSKTQELISKYQSKYQQQSDRSDENDKNIANQIKRKKESQALAKEKKKEEESKRQAQKIKEQQRQAQQKKKAIEEQEARNFIKMKQELQKKEAQRKQNEQMQKQKQKPNLKTKQQSISRDSDSDEDDDQISNIIKNKYKRLKPTSTAINAK